jgi:hypothetical protein
MACSSNTSKEYINFVITRFPDYSNYLANKPAYDIYNKAAKWYETNKDSSSPNITYIEDSIKNVLRSLLLKPKFPMANMLITKLKTLTANEIDCAALMDEVKKDCNCLPL